MEILVENQIWTLENLKKESDTARGLDQPEDLQLSSPALFFCDSSKIRASRRPFWGRNDWGCQKMGRRNSHQHLWWQKLGIFGGVEENSPKIPPKKAEYLSLIHSVSAMVPQNQRDPMEGDALPSNKHRYPQEVLKNRCLPTSCLGPQMPAKFYDAGDFVAVENISYFRPLSGNLESWA